MDQDLNKRNFTEPPDQKSRFLGISLLVTEIGAMVGYGLSGSFRNESQNGYQVLRGEIMILMLMFLFTAVGFGMLLNIYRFGNWLGSGGAILILAGSVQLGPLIQKLWINIILTGFGQRAPSFSQTTSVSQFFNNMSNSSIDIGTVAMRTTLLSSISLLVIMTAVVGRVSTTQIIKLISMYQIFWCCNYFLLQYFAVIWNDYNPSNVNYFPVVFDMFGTNYVYIYAVAFGLPFTFSLKKQAFPEIHPRNQFNRMSLLLSQIGTGIITAVFVFTSCYFINYKQFGTNYGNNYSRFSIIFGMIGSIVGTFLGSAIAGNGRVGYKQVLSGSISGGIVMSAAAPLVTNIGILLMIGGVTGILSGIYMRKLHVIVNQQTIKDVLGMFGPFAISALLGSFVVAPSILSVYYANDTPIPYTNGGLGQKILVEDGLAAAQLIYLGLSLGLGLAGGLFTSIFSVCDKQYFALASNSRMFLNDFGLYDLGDTSRSLQALPKQNNNTPTPTPGENHYMIGDSQQGLVRSGVLI